MIGKRGRIVIWTLLTLFLAANISAWHIGKGMSPDYESRLHTDLFVLKEVNLTIENDEVGLGFFAPPYHYFFSPSSGQVEISLDLNTAAAMRNHGMHTPRRNVYEETKNAVEFVGFVTAGGAVANVSSIATAVRTLSPVRRFMLKTGAGAAVIVGGIIGFSIGYSDEQNYESDAFITLVRSSEVWRDVWNRYAQCRALQQEIFNLRIAGGQVPDWVMDINRDPRPTPSRGDVYVDEECRGFAGLSPSYVAFLGEEDDFYGFLDLF